MREAAEVVSSFNGRVLSSVQLKYHVICCAGLWMGILRPYPHTLLLSSPSWLLAWFPWAEVRELPAHCRWKSWHGTVILFRVGTLRRPITCDGWEVPTAPLELKVLD